MLGRMLGEPPMPERKAAKRPREEPTQPLRRSGRERKEVSYVAPRITPLSGLILSAFLSEARSDSSSFEPSPAR